MKEYGKLCVAPWSDESQWNTSCMLRNIIINASLP